MRRLADYLRERLLNCRRAFYSYPSPRAKHGWTKSSVEELRAQADRVPQSQPLTHLDRTGAAQMVEISGKAETKRVATAVATLYFSDKKTYDALSSQAVVKGNAVAVARLAAIQAAKKTSDLVPLAHPSLGITAVSVDVDVFGPEERDYYYRRYTHQVKMAPILKLRNGGVTITATVKCEGKTGVEMEAITAATIGAVTMYDMLKAVDKGMVIMGTRVIKKEGGKSGDWEWDEINDRLVKAGDLELAESNEQTNRLTVKQYDTAVRHEPEPALDKKRMKQWQPLISDIDEWNKGLLDEFSLPETPQDVTSKSGEEMDSINITQKSDSSDSQTTIKDESESGVQSSHNQRNESQTEQTEEGKGIEARDGQQANTTEKETIQTSADSIPTTQTPLNTKFDSLPNQPQALNTPDLPNTASTTLLKQNLLAIQKSKYIQTLANSHEPNHRELQLDTAQEWRPYTMSPIMREDLTKEHKKVDSRDLAALRRRRYEEGGSGAGGSVIG